MNPQYLVFEFERLEDPDGHLVPLVVRMKLDLALCRISLDQWRTLSHLQREMLIAADVEHQDGVHDFRTLLDRVLQEAACGPAATLSPKKQKNLAAWARPHQPPDGLPEIRGGGNLRLEWASLTCFGRYVVWSLLRKGATEKLKAAIAELSASTTPTNCGANRAHSDPQLTKNHHP